MSNNLNKKSIDMNTHLDKRIVIIFSVLLMMILTSCKTQFPSVPFLRKTISCDSSKALLAISADYNMNSIYSNDVRFYFKEITSGKIISPDYRDQLGCHLYFNVPSGIYRISKILIKQSTNNQPTIDVTIYFNDSTKKIEKSMHLANSNNMINPGFGIGFSGVILTGDKFLTYSDTISNFIKIESNSAYFLGDYQFEGYTQGIFNDMPNIRIKRIDQVSEWKLKSIKKIYSDSYLNSTNEIVLSESPFISDYIDLAKKNALKKKPK